MNEFQIISHYFRRQHKRSDVILGSGDDAALLMPPKDQLLVSTIDMMNEGIHFFPGTAPENIGYKAVAVSLSDLAAMGAEPAWVVGSLSIPTFDQQWMEKFAEGFFELVDQYNMALVGGDLTRGPLSVSTQLTGFVPPNKAIKRTGAKPGDKIYVTGTIGDARAAFELLRAKKPVSDFLLSRLERPTPRVKEGILLRDIATAAIDISDGLLGDLNHLLEKNKLGADIDVNAIPTNAEWLDQKLLLQSGDDYELCFTVDEENTEKLGEIDCACIGVVTDSGEIKCFDQDKRLDVSVKGWQHF